VRHTPVYTPREARGGMHPVYASLCVCRRIHPVYASLCVYPGVYVLYVHRPCYTLRVPRDEERLPRASLPPFHCWLMFIPALCLPSSRFTVGLAEASLPFTRFTVGGRASPPPPASLLG